MALDPTIPIRGENMLDLQQKAQQVRQNEMTLAAMPEKIRQEQEAGRIGLETAGIQQKTAKLQQALQQNEIIAQSLSAATDPQSYQQVRARLASQGFDTSDLPEVFDPNVVRSHMMTSMSIKDQLEHELKVSLNAARIGTEQAQAGSFNALGRQRDAAARLNDANATRVLTPPPPMATPNQPQGQTVASLVQSNGTQNASTVAPAPTAIAPAPVPVKPMTATAQRMQNEALQALGTFSGLNKDIDTLISQIDNDKLDTDVFSRIGATVRNYTNTSNEKSRNLSTLQSKLESMRNAVLLLNKGVQTEGDAQRAMNEIINNPYDTALVKRRLEELKAINERAATLQQYQVEQVRRDNNQPQMDVSKFLQQPSTVDPASKPLSGLTALPDGYKDIGNGMVQGPDGKKYKIQRD